MKIGDEVLFLK